MQPHNEAEATPEQRARAIQYWETVVRPQMSPKRQDKPKEMPEQAFQRLRETAGQPVTVSTELAKFLATMKMSKAA